MLASCEYVLDQLLLRRRWVRSSAEIGRWHSSGMWKGSASGCRPVPHPPSPMLAACGHVLDQLLLRRRWVRSSVETGRWRFSGMWEELGRSSAGTGLPLRHCRGPLLVPDLPWRLPAGPIMFCPFFTHATALVHIILGIQMPHRLRALTFSASPSPAAPAYSPRDRLYHEHGWALDAGS